MKQVLILSASDSNLDIMNQAAKVLDDFGVEYELTISSAHRSAERTVELVQSFKSQGGKVIICGAGLAAHLAGVVAAHFPLPVIGVPLGGGALAGADALYATVQMPSGIPVATVGIDNAKNAGLLAVQILAVSDLGLEKKMSDYKTKLAQGIVEKAKGLEKNGSK